MRTVPPSTHASRLDAAAVLDLPPAVSTVQTWGDKACSTLGRQMMFPLRHGALGLHMESDKLSDTSATAFVAVAGAGHAEGPANGVPGQQDRAATGAAARDEQRR